MMITMTSAEARQHVAEINKAWQIIEQLGGNWFIAMTGAYFISSKPGTINITFRFRGSRRANYCKIELNARDLYDVKFFMLTPQGRIANEYEYNDVCAESLQSVFTEATGLDTHL